MNDYRIISTNILTHLKEVRLYDDTVEHVKDEHPEVPIELPSVRDAIERAVAMPTHVEASRTNPRSVVFVDADSMNKGGDPLRVPVKMVEGTLSGRVQTAYFGSTSSSVTVVWVRGNV